MRFQFASPLKLAMITARPNRFIMNISVNGVEYAAHCPTTGAIGNIDFSLGIVPCLVSESNDTKRKTKFTVEAISLQTRESENYSEWVGINQTKANKYVKYFLQQNQLTDMISGAVRSEVSVGKSRLDFQIGGNFLEIKTPLNSLETPDHIHNKKKKSATTSFSRLIKHFNELTDSLETASSSASAATSEANKKAIVALVFMYDAKAFVPPPVDKTNIEIISAATRATELGVETWQINLHFNREGVALDKYFRLS